MADTSALPTHPSYTPCGVAPGFDIPRGCKKKIIENGPVPGLQSLENFSVSGSPGKEDRPQTCAAAAAAQLLKSEPQS